MGDKVISSMDKCPRCRSKEIILTVRAPWSTDGLLSRGKIYVECLKCGYIIEIQKSK